MISIEISKDVDIVHFVVIRDTYNGAIILDCMGSHNQPADRYRADISSRDFILCLNIIKRISNDDIDGLAICFSYRLNAFTTEIRKGIKV